MLIRELMGVFSHSVGADRRGLLHSGLACLGLASILGALAWWLISGATVGGVEHMITPEVGGGPLSLRRSSGEVEYRWMLMAGGVLSGIVASVFLIVSIWTMGLAVFRQRPSGSAL